ncbi:unnamed protein product [Acanthosepion pharaonis]|uniref:Uncharacterized protein n=1 Tax=Acanthosepion pharaonis TaxID=158019 RepID=A0A812D7Q3_ACAPH|nr:unnamed protein product [Sepia pharaonis]
MICFDSFSCYFFLHSCHLSIFIYRPPLHRSIHLTVDLFLLSLPSRILPFLLSMLLFVYNSHLFLFLFSSPSTVEPFLLFISFYNGHLSHFCLFLLFSPSTVETSLLFISLLLSPFLPFYFSTLSTVYPFLCSSLFTIQFFPLLISFSFPLLLQFTSFIYLSLLLSFPSTVHSFLLIIIFSFPFHLLFTSFLSRSLLCAYICPLFLLYYSFIPPNCLSLSFRLVILV